MKHSITTRISITFLFVLSLAGISSCTNDADQVDLGRQYELVWSDEFTGDSGSLVDPSKWKYDIGTGSNGWGNNELQTYTQSAKNVSLDGKGNLKITALKVGSQYTSGRIKTEGLFTQEYGRIEARIKTPRGQGIWPAFWALGENIGTVGWPKCGEIDIMEQKGQYPFITYGSLHGPGYSGGNAVTNSLRLEQGNFTDDFNVYAVEWGVDYIDFYVNEKLYSSVKSSEVNGEWVYNHSFFLLLNVAVGGSFAGSPNDNTPFPGSMYIDYVRVFKEKG